MDAIPPPAQECMSFEYMPGAQMKNELGKCYARGGGDRLPDGSFVEIWNRAPGATRCSPVPRMYLHVRKDGQACIYWKVYEERVDANGKR